MPRSEDITSEESLFVPRNELKTFVRGALAQEVNDFLAVASKRRAERVGGAGNVIDVERNREIATQAEGAKYTYDTLVNRKGPISEAINQAAADYAQAKTRTARDKVKQAALGKVRDAILSEAEPATNKPAKKEPAPSGVGHAKLASAFQGSAGAKHNLVSFADLKDATGWSNEQLHANLRDLQKRGVLSLSGIEGRHGISARDSAAAIAEGNGKLGYASVRDEAQDEFRKLMEGGR